MRPVTLAGNWKLFKTKSETQAFCEAIKGQEIPSFMKVIVCPPFTNIDAAHSILNGSAIQIGAQTLYEKNEGAFTGEISGPMLRSVGCQYVIIGHSERRTYFSEAPKQLAEKIKAALQADLVPIFCVGESLEERESGKTFDVLYSQIKDTLEIVKESPGIHTMLVAYEPVWAIGTGKVATPEQAQDVHRFIRSKLQEFFNEKSDQISLLYGGSVKPENIESLLAQPDIDGALIGGASLDPGSFSTMIQIASKVPTKSNN